MPYEVRIHHEAEEYLQRLARGDPKTAQGIIRRIKWLADNGEVVNHIPLSGELVGLYKRQVGDYRVIYRIVREKAKNIIEIRMIGHRKEIYR